MSKPLFKSDEERNQWCAELDTLPRDKQLSALRKLFDRNRKEYFKCIKYWQVGEPTPLSMQEMGFTN